jgi:hypothetical protein
VEQVALEEGDDLEVLGLGEAAEGVEGLREPREQACSGGFVRL